MYSKRKSHVIQHQHKSCQFKKKTTFLFINGLFTHEKYLKQLQVPEKSNQRIKINNENYTHTLIAFISTILLNNLLESLLPAEMIQTCPEKKYGK